MLRLFYAITSLTVFILINDTVFSDGTVSETGKTGMSFLSVAPSSRAASLGGLASTLPMGASSIWSNPSLLALQAGRSAQFTHTEWIEGINQEFAAVSSPISIGTIGFAVQLFDSGDIELRGENPSEEPQGSYSINNVALSFAYARSLTDRIATGITYKKLFEKNMDANAGGYAFDAGITVKTPLDGVSIAATARNYGQMGILKNERTKLPSDVSFGAHYRGIFPILAQPYTLLADIVVPRYGDTGVRLGFEVAPIERFFFRMGYRSDSAIEDVSFGVGFVMDRVAGDISYTPMTEGFDSALRFTLSLMGF